MNPLEDLPSHVQMQTKLLDCCLNRVMSSSREELTDLLLKLSIRYPGARERGHRYFPELPWDLVVVIAEVAAWRLRWLGREAQANQIECQRVLEVLSKCAS